MTRTIKIIAVVIAVILVNIVSGFVSARLDFTEGQIYTLSPSTAKILAKIPDPIEIKVFLSEKLPPQIMTVRQQIVDKLSEYRNMGKGKVRLTFVDPAKDEDADKLAKALNIPALDLQVIEQDQMQVIKTYIGLVVLKEKKDYKDDGKGTDPLAKYEKKEAMPVIQNLESLEYDLGAILLKVASDKQMTIGLLNGHGEHSFALPRQFEGMQGLGGQRADYDINEQLQKTYLVTPVSLKENPPAEGEKDKGTQQAADPLKDISTLVVAGPTEEIPADEASKIYDFVKKGGNVIFLMDKMQLGLPFSMTASSISTNTNLLEPWGLRVEPQLVADSNSGTATFNQGFVTYMLPYPLFVKAAVLDRLNPMTRGLESFILPWTNPITITKKEGVKVDVIAQSSEFYNLMEETKPDAATQSPKGTQESTQQVQPDQKPQPIDVNPQQEFNIRGQKKTPVALAVVAQKINEGKILVVGNSMFISRSFPNRTQENMVFFFNAIDALSLGDDLIAIRSKSITDRPIAKLSQAEKSAIQWGLTLGLPLIFIAYGFTRRAIRNAKKKTMSRD